MRPENYFDHAATTPVDDRVREAMLPWLGERFGNAHSLHQAGREAREAVERARAQVADLLGAEDPSEIVFTSGATESNNWVLSSATDLWISPFEHSSVREPGLRRNARLLDNRGFELSTAPPEAGLVSAMLVNNETGAIFRPERVRPQRGRLHSDVTQAVGRVRFEARAFDWASLSSHKIYGPMGVGALYARDGLAPDPLIVGGGQESGRRSGTLNVAGIVGFGAAAALAHELREERYRHASELRAIVVEGLGSVSDCSIHDAPEQSPFILSVGFVGVEGAPLAIALDHAGFAVSAGAACSSGSRDPSPTLIAIGLDPELASGTVRISFGDRNTRDSARNLARALAEAVKSLRLLKTRP